jgi:hypothetical protein
VEHSSKTPIAPEIMRFLSRHINSSTAYTGIPILDAMFKAYPSTIRKIDESPENFMIVVYGVLYETIEQLLLKSSLGNYFDFNKADNLTSSYKVEYIVSELIKKPLQTNIGHQSAQRKLTEEEEREALW